MDAEQARIIGARLRRIRNARGNSLRVIAGLATMSSSILHRIEHGQRGVTLSEIVALARALEIAPSELTKLLVPAPANGHTDSTTEAVCLALDAIDADYPDGLVLPLAALREQVTQIDIQLRACQFAEVTTELPGLIHNLHTALATGTDHAELLDLTVYLHVHVTRKWLSHAAAPTDLVRRTAFLARRLAYERNEITALAVAEFAVADVLLAGGALELGRAKLDSITLPPTTAGLIGLVTAAADVAGFGATHDVDSLGFVFGPGNAGCFRMWLALEAHEPDQVVDSAREIDPERMPFPVNRSVYWVHYGRALAQLRGRHADAVRALRTAEELHLVLVRRHPMARDAISMLLPGARRDAIGTELRRMAHRAGLPE